MELETTSLARQQQLMSIVAFSTATNTTAVIAPAALAASYHNQLATEIKAYVDEEIKTLIAHASTNSSLSIATATAASHPRDIFLVYKSAFEQLITGK
jgi:hypothetical protein